MHAIDSYGPPLAALLAGGGLTFFVSCFARAWRDTRRWHPHREALAALRDLDKGSDG